MRFSRNISAWIAALCVSAHCYSQTDPAQDSTTYKVSLFASVATGEHTPFWMVSNRYGVVPLDAGNGVVEAGVFHSRRLGKGFRWGAALDVAAAAPRHHNVFVQQAYAEIGYRSLLLSVGSKERYNSLRDRRLSSGDMVQSANARPVPEINLGLPEFAVIPLTKGWLQAKGDFALGKSFDTDYLEDWAGANQQYVKHVLWHHKSLFLRVKDTNGGFPLSLTIGAQHFAQWGGTSTSQKIGKQPQSFKDMIRVILGKAGGEDASLADRLNVLGSHFGAFDFRLRYEANDRSGQFYYQHYFNDRSGIEFANKADGLWGVQIELPYVPWISKIVGEYLVTMNQSGPIHYVAFDHNKWEGSRGGGDDDYYNNKEYTTGLSYFNRGIGSPLIISPEYNKGGKFGFKNNRIKSWHIGAEGIINTHLSYRALFTVMNGRGTSYFPFLSKKQGTSSLIDINYTHPRLGGWLFTGSVAADTGTMVGSGVGFSLSVTKTGLLKARK